VDSKLNEKKSTQKFHYKVRLASLAYFNVWMRYNSKKQCFLLCAANLTL